MRGSERGRQSSCAISRLGSGRESSCWKDPDVCKGEGPDPFASLGVTPAAVADVVDAEVADGAAS